MELAWQDFILDARLRQVVDQALCDSRPLREQAAAVISARSQYRVQRAQLLPAINAGVSGTKSRSVLDGFPGITGAIAYEAETDQATVGLTSWEIVCSGGCAACRARPSRATSPAPRPCGPHASA